MLIGLDTSNSNSPQIQEAALQILPAVFTSFDAPTLRNSLLPKMQMIYVQSGATTVKIAALKAIESIMAKLDKVYS